MVYDIWALFARNPGAGWILLLQPVLSTSALLLLFVGLQFMMIGMVADGVSPPHCTTQPSIDPLSSQDERRNRFFSSAQRARLCPRGELIFSEAV